jgi:hypothetical protein
VLDIWIFFVYLEVKKKSKVMSEEKANGKKPNIRIFDEAGDPDLMSDAQKEQIRIEFDRIKNMSPEEFFNEFYKILKEDEA